MRKPLFNETARPTFETTPAYAVERRVCPATMNEVHVIQGIARPKQAKVLALQARHVIPNGEIAICTDNHKIVGYVWLTQSLVTYIIEQLGLPNANYPDRSGVAAALLRWSWMRYPTAKTLSIVLPWSDTDVIELLEGFGFKTTPGRPGVAVLRCTRRIAKNRKMAV